MADAAGQQSLSPYHAMACNPSTMVDPLGLAAQYSAALSNPNVNMAPAGLAMVEGQAIMFGSSLLGGGVSDMMRNLSQTMDEAHHDHQVMQIYNYLVSTLGDGNVQSAQSNNTNGEQNYFDSEKSLNQLNPVSEIGFTTSYSGDLSKYKGVFWFQTISTDFSYNGKSEYVDFSPVKLSLFCNPTESDNEATRQTFDMYEIKRGDYNFSDFPKRPAIKSFYWKAELSLVGISDDGTWNRIQTISWGWRYDMNANKNIFYPSTITNFPSPFHQQFFGPYKFNKL